MAVFSKLERLEKQENTLEKKGLEMVRRGFKIVNKMEAKDGGLEKKGPGSGQAMVMLFAIKKGID